MPVFLRPTSGTDTELVQIDKPPIQLVGRHPDCDIVINNSRKVSRKHCCIALINNRFLIRDLGSMNGVRVNGKLVKRDKYMNIGDEVQIGDVKYTLCAETNQPQQPPVQQQPPAQNEQHPNATRQPIDNLLNEEFERESPDADAGSALEDSKATAGEPLDPKYFNQTDQHDAELSQEFPVPIAEPPLRPDIQPEYTSPQARYAGEQPQARQQHAQQQNAYLPEGTLDAGYPPTDVPSSEDFPENQDKISSLPPISDLPFVDPSMVEEIEDDPPEAPQPPPRDERNDGGKGTVDVNDLPQDFPQGGTIQPPTGM